MRALAFACLILSTLPVFAARFGFTVRTAAGAVVERAEVCAFAAGATPLEQWFRAGPIDCFPATTVVAFPRGQWNVFAVAGDRYASTHPYLLSVREDPRDTDSGYREITIDVAPAAAITLTGGAAAEDRVVLYFPGTKKTLAFALPMPAGAETITIPAMLPFVPVLIREGELRFGDSHPGTAAGARIRIDDFTRPATRDAVVYLDAPSRPPDDLPPPQIELIARGRTHGPVVSPAPLRDRDLLIVKDVTGAEETATLRIGGPTWESAETTVRIGRTTRIADVRSLRLAPAAELRVGATTQVLDWLRGLEDSECREDRGVANTLELHCIGDRCSEPRVLPLVDGRATFAGVPLGTYELRLGNLWQRTVHATPGSFDIALDVPLFTLAGTVTRNGKPVRARVSAGSGSAVSETDGTYAIRFPKETDRAVIRDCAGETEFVHLSDVPLSTLAKLDVELPSPMTVRIVDGTTSKPIPGARVHAIVVDPADRHAERFKEVPAPAGENGEVTLRRTPLTKFSVCARADDYAPRCVPGTATNPTVVALARVETFAGVVEGVSGVRSGMLFFVTADGAELEVVTVDADGRFKHRRPHGPGERAVFISASHPLAVLLLPATGPLRLRMPVAPVRDVVIRTGAEAEYEIGLAIGNVIVPAGALARHQTFRGRMPFTTNGEAVLASLVESAPIVVYRGFARLARPPHLAPAADPFAQPELRAQFPSAAAGAGPVIFR